MTRVRAIWTDLVERRLWPIPVALLIALVAVPLLLSGGGDKAVAPASPAQSAAPPNAVPAAVVSVDATATAKKRSRKGSVRDPFVQQHVPPPASSTATGTTTGSPGINLTPASNLDINYGANPVSGDSPTSSGPPTSSTPTVHVPDTSAKYVYRIALRDRELGDVTWHLNVARNDRVPSKKDPLAIFVGVMADRKTAVFVMNKLGKAEGSGTCRPSRRACVTFELKRGESMLLTLPQANGTVRRVRLTLGAIVVAPKRTAISSDKR